MDETYIKMCRTATEIQEAWEPKIGDRILNEVIWMREIKYRAFIKRLKTDTGILIENEMLPVTGLHFHEGDELTQISIDSDYGELPDIYIEKEDKDIFLMQFTGLKDANGTEIYEGDIIQMGKIRGYVYFDEGCFDVERRQNKVPYNENKYIRYVDWPSEFFEGCKVIGNIWENPELIK